jgi:TPP-dependent pyruvate/acetoin dehydrogenase alpha subunit
VTLAVIGDGALNQGAVHESLNFAAVMKLPLVVIVENNGYAELTPADAMYVPSPLSLRGKMYGIPSQTVDGNDVDTVSTAIASALSSARSGMGPQLVEAMTHRLSGHYDLDPQAYRPDGELERARLVEPLARLAAVLDPGLIDTVRAEVDLEIETAIDAAREVPLPDPETAGRHLYA